MTNNNNPDDAVLRSLLMSQETPEPHGLEQKIMRGFHAQKDSQKQHHKQIKSAAFGRVWATGFVVAALIALVVFTNPFDGMVPATNNDAQIALQMPAQTPVDPWIENNIDPLINQYEAAYYLLEAEEEQEIDQFLDGYMSPNVELL